MHVSTGAANVQLPKLEVTTGPFGSWTGPEPVGPTPVKVSVSVSPVALAGPPLVTFTEYATAWLAAAVLGVDVTVIDTGEAAAAERPVDTTRTTPVSMAATNRAAPAFRLVETGRFVVILVILPAANAWASFCRL